MVCPVHRIFVFHPILSLLYLTGALVYMSVVGQTMLVLNTHKAAADLLDRRGTIYGDRPRLICKLCG